MARRDAGKGGLAPETTDEPIAAMTWRLCSDRPASVRSPRGVHFCLLALAQMVGFAGRLAGQVPGGEVPGPGFSFSGLYVGDAFYNARGGAREGGVLLHNVDLTLALDGGAAFGISGLDAFLYVLANDGNSLSERTGDLQVASNIDAPNAVRLYEAWLQRSWGETFSLKLGLYDLNSEFYASDVAALFLNSAHGVGSEFGLSGPNGPSIFPVTSLGARLAWVPAPGTYALAAVLDGVPGDPEDEEAFVDVDLSSADGALVVAEAGLVEEGRKIGAGAWGYTTDLPDAVDVGETHGIAYGAYVLWETVLSPAGEGPRSAAHARVGFADPGVHALQFAWAGGVVRWTGRGDRIGFGIANAFLSERYEDAAGDEGGRSEISLEVTGSFRLTDWLTVQPDAQYIMNPGIEAGLRDAIVFGVRVEVGF